MRLYMDNECFFKDFNNLNNASERTLEDKKHKQL